MGTMKEYILPLRDLVMHPGLTVPVLIDNPMSVACIEAAAKNRQKIVLTAQHTWGYPTNPEDIYDIGTIGDIAQILRMPDGSVHVMIRTTDAVTLADITVENGIFTGAATPIEIMDDAHAEQTMALRDKVAKNLQMLSGNRKIKMDKLRRIIRCRPLSIP